ncbi:hypothetical protein E2562_031286 [Oryza meyeriana var. granulata]|uniref:Uncharacterized protein n=1 Tax=Oryza meyeriana var. granulata TaxID=110450 RepID=A0A6G1E3U5_9ORYZ|nr:hypothetical protein E2562_031286 [Oryza meyeriana var. granulata]
MSPQAAGSPSVAEPRAVGDEAATGRHGGGDESPGRRASPTAVEAATRHRVAERRLVAKRRRRPVGGKLLLPLPKIWFQQEVQQFPAIEQGTRHMKWTEHKRTHEWQEGRE